MKMCTLRSDRQEFVYIYKFVSLISSGVLYCFIFWYTKKQLK